MRVLPVLIYLRTNLTTRALAALFHTSQSTVDRVIHSQQQQPWIIDGTLIPVHDQSIAAISKNYPRSLNTQIIICAHRRRVLVAPQCCPANRNDVIVAVAHLLTDQREILGDGGYRGSRTITTPRRENTGRTIHDGDYGTPVE